MSLPVKATFQLVNTATDSNSLSSSEDASGIKSRKYTEYLCHGESEASTLVSSFYRNLGLTIRVVDVKKILAERTKINARSTKFRPFSCLFPGSKRVVVKPVSDLNEWKDIVINGVVTVHKPIADGIMKWAYKRDGATDKKGETTHAGLKKITDFAILKDKTMECRDESLFLTRSSGHVGRDGYLLHQPLLQKVENANDYPEIICPYNFDQTHCGYLLDFRREQCFINIARFMENILLLESGDDAGQMTKPAVIFLYDSFRGGLLPPVELNGTLLKKIADNARVFTRYPRSLDEERKLFNLLAHAGYKRFLQLLMNNIPDSVNAVANTPQPINMASIKQAIVNLEADKAVTMLSEIDDELINRIGLPTTLMDQLTYNPVFTYQDCKDYKYPDIDDFFRHHIGKNRSRKLMRTTFAAQGKICRALLKKNVFVPVILQGEDSLYNPLVCCLLIANGSRINFAGWGFKVSLSLFPIIAARKFYRENLLSEAELKIIRYETLWQIVSNSTTFIVTDPDKILKRFRKLVNTLARVLEQRYPAGRVQRQCRQIFSDELYTSFYLAIKASGLALKQVLEKGLSTQRYNDKALWDYVRCISSTMSRLHEGTIFYQDELYLIDKYRAINRFPGKDFRFDWLEALLATPPIFDQRESQRMGRYRALTLEAGQHYYQSPHPSQAKAIIAAGLNSCYRHFHGLDHALRTQLATEFLLEILTDFHLPFKKLLKLHQPLQELIPIAELYHDAVAEVEAKENEELRAAELFLRDMRELQQYPEPLIALVADALRNKNSNKMHPVPAPFTADDQCPEEELLLRRVLRFGDTVDIMRVYPPRPDFPAIKQTAGSAKLTAATLNDGYFHPEAIELLGVVNHPEFTQLIQAALLTFRNLASITGGWHNHSEVNPFSRKYGLSVDNDKRRLRIERAPEPYVCLRESLDDLVRLVIAQKAGVQPCFAEHSRHKDSTPAPDCWDPGIGFAGAYRKLHSEQELWQVRLPTMTLKEKIIVVAEELPSLETKWLSSATDRALKAEIRRLQQKGILPAIGTPRQSELEQILKQPDCVGAKILNERELAVVADDHEGRTLYRMVPKRSKRQCAEPDNDAGHHNTGPAPKRRRSGFIQTSAVIMP
ncbi:hypothetical protein [Salinisphaera sp. G21_0]|uniref:hypothetical protein n=1 Tax=Salinisphaera sp. G21_0 TaxID=2821094 RepID=UPI001AD9C119|nr:hypothetical protein [Salinisphaera sp. G21_0]MBO9480685.1 hypothetical protein [Salinisphaera sp. G21_0]